MDIKKESFTKDLYKKLKRGAAKYNPKSDKKVFDTYPYFMKYRRKLKVTDDLIVAISIAYSWMPTMLDIYEQSERTLGKLKTDIIKLGGIKTSQTLLQREKEVKDILEKLSKATNNSVIGASKVLHMFYPLHIPIFDSRVIAAWNKIMRKEAKIPHLNRKNQESVFYSYWLGILYWREALKHTGVRRIEKKLFDYGGLLKERQRKENVQKK